MQQNSFDFLIVGSGLYGCVMAHELAKRGKRCLVLERRAHVGGNVYCEEREGIRIHRYGAHIFHTSDTEVWQYVNGFVTFNNYVNSPVANYMGHLYNLPFNMNTFRELWDIVTPAEARKIIDEQRKEIVGEPKNLEEQAISLVGSDIYEKLIKGYTEKQWGRSCTELPAFIIRRLPVRFTFDNNYFNDRYQGIPEGGYNVLIEKLLDDTKLAGSIEVRTDVDYNASREDFANVAKDIIYTGAIDAYYDYKFGPLAYRGLRFETERFEEENHQGVAVMNYTLRSVPFTRTIEHKHFEFGTQPVTYVTREYPADWKPGEEAYYPVNDAENSALYEKYRALAESEPHVHFGGRLAEYKYYDMDDTIRAALDAVEQFT
ncbi:UDP-galactopyranose mutase [uncultured Selenomonas sp.]|uniref:UDP-galactopyranose mutase n=1 Tax=uncultured Selenomonas sp. TaxID=159275 RepID=UPI0025F59CD7|nr:UDP-galactopyranose mutase [uncultured Selenomonas sp.]